MQRAFLSMIALLGLALVAIGGQKSGTPKVEETTKGIGELSDLATKQLNPH